MTELTSDGDHLILEPEQVAADAPPLEAFESDDAGARDALRGDLGARALRSAAWRGVANVMAPLIRLGVLAVLARRLPPSAFGVVAMSAVVIGSAATLAEFGLGSAVIQRPRLTSGQLRWVFRVNLALSVLLWIICLAASPWVGKFFHEPMAGPVLAVSAAVLPLSAIAFVPRALLVRRLEFRKLVTCELAGAVGNAVTAIAMALSGQGVWSLVAGALVGAAVTSASLMALSPWRPTGAAGRPQAAAGLLQFGMTVAGLSLLNYWAYSVDNLVVGRTLGAAALGVYAMAFTLAIMPVGQLSGLASSVAFPSFSAIQEDRERLTGAYLRCLRWSAALTFPFCALMIALSPQVIAVFLGAKWAAAALPLRLLLVVAAARSLYTFTGAVLRAVGKPQIELLLQAMLFAGVAAAALIGSRGGIVGVAAAVAGFISLLAAPTFLAVTAREARSGLLRTLREVAAPAGASAAGGAAAFGLARAAAKLSPGAPDVLVLVAGAAVGVALYAVTMRGAAPDLLGEVWKRVRSAFGARPQTVAVELPASGGGG